MSQSRTDPYATFRAWQPIPPLSSPEKGGDHVVASNKDNNLKDVHSRVRIEEMSWYAFGELIPGAVFGDANIRFVSRNHIV
jgi:hypothetical protein